MAKKDDVLKKNLLEDGKEQDKKREKKKRKEKPREPNVLGGGLTVLTLVVLFFVIRAFSHTPPTNTTDAQKELQKQQKESAQAKEHLKSQLSDTAQNVRGNFTNESPLDSAMASLDKVNRDIDSAKRLPEQTVETVKNLKIGDAITIVLNTTGRLGKVYSDAKEVHKALLKEISKL